MTAAWVGTTTVLKASDQQDEAERDHDDDLERQLARDL